MKHYCPENPGLPRRGNCLWTADGIWMMQFMDIYLHSRQIELICFAVALGITSLFKTSKHKQALTTKEYIREDAHCQIPPQMLECNCPSVTLSLESIWYRRLQTQLCCVHCQRDKWRDSLFECWTNRLPLFLLSYLSIQYRQMTGLMVKERWRGREPCRGNEGPEKAQRRPRGAQGSRATDKNRCWQSEGFNQQDNVVIDGDRFSLTQKA